MLKCVFFSAFKKACSFSFALSSLFGQYCLVLTETLFSFKKIFQIFFILRREKGNDLFNIFRENELSLPLSLHKKQGIFFSYCFVQVSFESLIFFFNYHYSFFFLTGICLNYLFSTFHSCFTGSGCVPSSKTPMCIYIYTDIYIQIYIYSVYYEGVQQFEYLSIIEINNQIKGGVTI